MDAMNTNAYAPPKANLQPSGDAAAEAGISQAFYVVSQRKFVILFVMTLGVYQLYWFYQNWLLYKRNNQVEVWPVPRAIFAIFFTHTLFESVDRFALKQGIRIGWTPRSLATTSVVFTIASSVLDRLSRKDIGSPWVDLLSLVTMAVVGVAQYHAQVAINKACGDSQGESNSTLTWANYIWIVLGGLFWLMVIVGLVAMFTGQI